MIEVKDLTKTFGDKTVLDKINMVFETGKTNLIIGQSGSGKTVLMKNLVGLLTPDKRTSPIRRSKLCGNVEEGKDFHATRDGHDIPKCSPLRLLVGTQECNVSTRHVFIYEL